MNYLYHFNVEFCVNTESEDKAIDIVETLINDKVTRFVNFTDDYQVKSQISQYEDNQYYIEIDAKHVESMVEDLYGDDIKYLIEKALPETDVYELQGISLLEEDY